MKVIAAFQSDYVHHVHGQVPRGPGEVGYKLPGKIINFTTNPRSTSCFTHKLLHCKAEKITP